MMPGNPAQAAAPRGRPRRPGAWWARLPATRVLAAGAWLLAALVLPPVAGCASPPASGSGGDVSSMQSDSRRYIVLAVDNPLEPPPARAGSTLGNYGPAPRYLLGARAAATLNAIAREHGLREAAGWPIAALGWHCVVFEMAPGSSREAVLAALTKDPRVRLAEPLQDFDTRAALPGEPPAAGASTPATGAGVDGGLPYNDPYVNLQRGFVDLGAARAHRVSTGAGIDVALVDTGAELDHPDLRGRVALARDLVGDGAGGGFEADRHGTEVAGVIAAAGNNREGIVGIAPQARLVLFRACWSTAAAGAVAGGRCNSFTLAKALAAVLQSDAKVVNLSLGGPSDPLLDRLLAELLRQGRIVVGALPPDGRRGGFPTGTPGVIAAGVAGELGAGAGADVVAAPGRDVLTLQPGGRYDYASGTSIAAAHVSGVAALLLAAQPRLDRVHLCALMGSSAGHTPLDAGKALHALER